MSTKTPASWPLPEEQTDAPAAPPVGTGAAPWKPAGEALHKAGLVLFGLFVFILALELMRLGAREYGRVAIEWLNISNAANAVGLGWLMAYVFLSGSPVAAVAVTLFSAETLDALQTFSMITGSRLGASFIVLLVGFIYHLLGRQRSNTISIGVLALLTTAVIYLPALLIGYFIIRAGWLGTLPVSVDSPLHSFLDLIFDPVMNAITALGLPGWVIFILGAGTLMLSFQSLDRALPEVKPDHSRFQGIGKLVYRPAAMFLFGIAITSITMSVAVSLSILVPLSARGIVRRENTLPYILGANIATFIDTLVAALIVGGPAAFMIVLLEMVTVAVLSLIVLLFFYRPFERNIMRVQEWFIRDRQTLTIFLGILCAVPLFLLFL